MIPSRSCAPAPRRRRAYAAGLLAATVLLFGPRPAHASQPVVGALESISAEGVATGWALDQDAPSTPIFVHFYLDGPAGVGQIIGGATANLPRTDVNPPGNHGFWFSIPREFLDGRVHTLYVHGIDLSGVASEHVLLAGVPQTFTASIPSAPGDSTLVSMDNGLIRVGLETKCGGTLAELRYLGQNLINNYDCTGRQVQAAFYDGDSGYDDCAGCSGVWGWDPVQGGDKYNFGSPVLAQHTDGSSIYIATRPYEWNPDNKGGGPGQPVLSDIQIEQWLSFVPDNPHAVRLRYRIAHLGLDTHANAVQEFPAVYVNSGFDRFVYYGGTAPWTSAAVTNDALPLPGEPNPQKYLAERWAALVDSQGVGLSVYVPQQYPYGAGLRWDGTTGEFGLSANYFRPHVPFTFGPASVLEGDIFLIAGDYREARRTIYALQAAGATPDILPPFGWMDAPFEGQSLTGSVPVSGWTFDNVGMGRVEVLVDGVVAGAATHGLSRTDVPAHYPNASPNTGYTFPLDTTRYANGWHRVAVRTVDRAANVAMLRGASVLIDNPPPAPETPADTAAPAVSITGVNLRGQTLKVTAAASDDTAVVRVDLYIDGRLAGSRTSAPYAFRVDAKQYTPGAHPLFAVAADAAGNRGVSGVVNWTAK